MSFEGILLEESTKKRLESYLTKVSGGLILQGDKGIGKSLCAKIIACSILSCTEKELVTHPDFFCIEPDNGTVKIEQMQLLRNKSSLVAARAEKKVFIIDDADKMSVSAQNAILKVLEDGNKTNIIIFVTSEALLPTIHSRSTTIMFKNPSKEELYNFIVDKDEDVLNTPIAIANGKVGLYYQVRDSKDFIADVDSILNTFNTMNKKRELFEAFHLLKEKEKSFYERYDSELVEAFITLIKDVFTELIGYQYGKLPEIDIVDFKHLDSKYSILRTLIVTEQIQTHLFRMKKKGNYNKNDFFELVRLLVD